MKALLASVSVLALGMGSLLTLGCETDDCKDADGNDAKCASSLSEFKGPEQTFDEDYVDGASLTIDGLYGAITVVKGSAGVVSTTFEPFNYRGHDKQDEALQEIEDSLQVDMSADADGNLSVTSDRTDSELGNLGARITVALPPEFNGVLIVRNAGEGNINPGYIEVKYVGEATTLNVVNDGDLENCNVLRPEDDDDSVPASTLTETDVRCEADITVRGVNDNVVVQSRDATFHSNVRVEIASIGADATGGDISGDNSSIEVILPVEGSYDVVATASGPDAHIGKLETADCATTTSETAEVRLLCGGGGPTYTITAEDADEDDDDTSFVNVLVTN
jgi:hypothetical protein